MASSQALASDPRKVSKLRKARKMASWATSPASLDEPDNQRAKRNAASRCGRTSASNRRRFSSTKGTAQCRHGDAAFRFRSEEHTSELQSLTNLVCPLLLEKKMNLSRTAQAI